MGFVECAASDRNLASPASGVIFETGLIGSIIGGAADPRAAERILAALAAIVIVLSTLSGMAIWLQSNGPRSQTQQSIETIILTPPLPKRLPPNQVGLAPANPAPDQAAPPSGGGENAATMQAAAPTMFQWSVSRMAAGGRPSLSNSPNGAGNSDLAPSLGMGGSGVFDPYAGSSPQWQGRSTPAPQLAPNETVMRRLRSELGSVAGAETFNCDVLVGLNGTILEGRCTTPSGIALEALPARLVGVALFDSGNSVWRTTLQF